MNTKRNTPLRKLHHHIFHRVRGLLASWLSQSSFYNIMSKPNVRLRSRADRETLQYRWSALHADQVSGVTPSTSDAKTRKTERWASLTNRFTEYYRILNWPLWLRSIQLIYNFIQCCAAYRRTHSKIFEWYSFHKNRKTRFLGCTEKARSGNLLFMEFNELSL